MNTKLKIHFKKGFERVAAIQEPLTGNNEGLVEILI